MYGVRKIQQLGTPLATMGGGCHWPITMQHCGSHVKRPLCSAPSPQTPLFSKGALEGMSGASALCETGREALTFSGRGEAVFAGLPAFEAVHFGGSGDTAGQQSEVRCCQAGLGTGSVFFCGIIMSRADGWCT